MEEMNNILSTDNTVTEMVEVADKVTFKENVLAYALVGIFAAGLTTIGFLGYKGAKSLSKKIKSKKEKSVIEPVECRFSEEYDIDEESNN